MSENVTCTKSTGHTKCNKRYVWLVATTLSCIGNGVETKKNHKWNYYHIYEMKITRIKLTTLMQLIPKHVNNSTQFCHEIFVANLQRFWW